MKETQAAPDASTPYLAPYLEASAVHGSAFRTLLWASPKTQRCRFDALARIQDLSGRSLLDVGCGRADLLDYLTDRGARLADYTGIEALPALADAAEQKLASVRRGFPGRIIRDDFVREPRRLFVGADVVLFSGSLNTLTDDAFYPALRRAFDAATEAVAFNFLASPALAGKAYLFWREPADVLAFAASLGADVSLLDDYLHGDCTVRLRKKVDAA